MKSKRKTGSSPSSPASLSALAGYSDSLLNHSAIGDFSGAKNGLQIENNGTVTRIAAAVDATERTLRAAIEKKADLMIVHHGLFWSDISPVTGFNYRKLKLALDHNLALYSSHLPLDAHPKLGNNALLAKAIGLKKTEPFFEEKGAKIGLLGGLPLDRAGLKSRLTQALGQTPHLIDGGPEKIRRIAIVTGGAGAEMAKAAAAGADTFITGEGPHWTDSLARDLGLNVFYGGHYLTETFGVKALAEHLSKRFGLPWVFLDFPTGL